MTTPNAPTAREAIPKRIAVRAVQSLADSLRLKGTPQESLFVVSGEVLEEIIAVTISNAIYDGELVSPAALLAARREVERANARIAGHEAIFRWLQGEEGEFPESVPGKRYNFRTELSRRFAALAATQEEKNG